MTSEASGSKNQLQPPSPQAEAGTYLAPGFRFHPTDEELISYYLKRKITGKPIRADAISEIDLYREEPWDLPSRSRLRSRDLEWYFFTALDRKYSNRCRTNRATAEGYWKTTGKDRLIQSRSRTIGMKKTLVYHAGRAPRGQRTNWVMHEYRLDDEELARSRISQDGYVLCRVFQKNGSGPQNGAQYGAPFIEEEWEREEEGDANIVPVNANQDALMCPTGHDFVQLGDFLVDPNSGTQHLGSLTFEETTSDNQQEHSSKGILNGQDSFDDMPLEGENNVLKGKLDYAFMPKGYVQIKDMFSGDDASMSRSKILLRKGIDDDSNNDDCTQLDQLEMCPTVQKEIFPQSFIHSCDAPWEYPSGQFSEDDLVYYDALSHEIPYSEDGADFENSLSPFAEFDLLEDLISFYDTTHDSVNNSAQIQFLSRSDSPAVDGSSTSSSKEVFNVPENLGKMSSLGRPPADDSPSIGYDGVTKDAHPEGCEDKSLTERLASMLYSISAPPAFADESGLIGKGAAAAAAPGSTSLRLTAGMIQIDNWTALGDAERWTLQKHAELGFFSYGMNASMSSKSVGSGDSKSKVLSGVYSAFCRIGLPLFFLSAVLLAFTHKSASSVCQPPP